MISRRRKWGQPRYYAKIVADPISILALLKEFEKDKKYF